MTLGKVLIQRWSPNFRPIFDGVVVPAVCKRIAAVKLRCVYIYIYGFFFFFHILIQRSRLNLGCLRCCRRNSRKVLFWNTFVLGGGADREAVNIDRQLDLRERAAGTLRQWVQLFSAQPQDQRRRWTLLPCQEALAACAFEGAIVCGLLQTLLCRDGAMVRARNTSAKIAPGICARIAQKLGPRLKRSQCFTICSCCGCCGCYGCHVQKLR